MRMISLLLGVAVALAPAASSANEGPAAAYEETEVTVGADGWPLPGILTVPRPAAGAPVVVLVHGSGPHDADQTVFANKPFRDIAHGLAERGIASLRYVKRSKAHGLRMLEENPDVTIREEVIDDAVAAVEWLHARPDIAGDRIYVLGHSLGAMLAPRIALSAGDRLAGAILMAANARPLEDVALDQIRYLAPSQGITEAQLAGFEAQRERVKAVVRGEDADGPLLLGLPAGYWRDLSSNDPVETARRTTLPLLILQGERDYQVTMDDFKRWRHGLADRADVAFRSYPALNHLFMAGTGPSLPAEYFVAGRVDAQVIDDIAEWIHARAQMTAEHEAKGAAAVSTRVNAVRAPIGNRP